MIKTEIFDFGKPGDGRNLLITTGLHGNEIAPLFFGNYLIKKLELHFKENNDYFGFTHVKVINGINISGIIKNTREMCDLVEGDPNRGWVDTDDVNTSEILKNLHNYKYDYFLIDVHTSDSCADIFLYNLQKEMPRHFWNCVNNDIPYAVWESETNSLKSYFKEDGVTYEINGMNRRGTPISTYKHFELFIKSLNTDTTVEGRELTGLDTLKYMKAPYSGLVDIRGNYKLGDLVCIGDTLGYIFDFKGDKIYTIKSEYSGRLIQGFDRDFVNAGDDYIGIQPINNT